MTENSGLDREMILGLRELLGEKFSELISSYITDCSRRIVNLREAIEQHDFTTINHESHGLKGSSRNIGANSLADICGELERLGKDQQVSGLEQHFAAVEKNFADVAEELKSLL